MRKRSKKSSIDDYLYHIVIGLFILVCLLAIGNTLMKDKRKLSEIPVFEDDKIDYHNENEESTYKLAKNEFFIDWFLSDAKTLLTG